MPGATVQIYCDESGFSGNNLLDSQQPYFAYAAVAIDHAYASTLVSALIRDYNIQSPELKGSKLLKYNKGRQAITQILKTCGASCRLAVHEKKFALASQFFEYVFEPALAEQNSIFYRANFHKFIAALVYAHWVGRDPNCKQLIENFSTMMRSLDHNKLQPRSPATLTTFENDKILDQIALFAHLNRASIEDELAVLYGDGVTPNWILDLSTTSLFQILSDFATRFTDIEVMCDASKPLLANRYIFDKMVNRSDMPIHPHWTNMPFGFNLSREVQFVDSSVTPGVQIADVIAATASFVFQNRRDSQACEWFPYIHKSYVNGILPDLDYADPNSEDGFVGAMILYELVGRSLRKESLFAGMPEYILAARRSFPAYARQSMRERSLVPPR